MTEREDYNSEHCRNCQEWSGNLTNYLCSDCVSNKELSDKINTKTIDLTKANNKATK